jgi:two-component system NtrC family sensor kinase
MRDRRRLSGVEPKGAGKVAASEPVPASVTEASSPRVRMPDVVPTLWLDRLLVAVIDLPIADGERAVVQAIVDAVAGILPAYAVGACVAPEAEGPDGRLIVRRLPPGTAERGVDAHPSRIFPALSYEYLAEVPGVCGATLHIASQEIELEPDSSPAAHLLDRAALALGRALAGARSAAAHSGPSFDQRMAQADKLATFGQIAAGVVHELNNPLTSIVAYSDLLIRKASAGAGGDPDDLDRLRRISEAANRMLRFTRDLVSYARPSTGAAQPVVLHDVIDQAVAFCEHVLAAASVRVERRYSQDVRAVIGVTEQLVQVFINLLTNACQAAPGQDGLVVLTTAFDPVAPLRISVVVEDNGSGIAVKHLPHVFAPFFTTKGDRQGTGLGLSIVKSIVEGHRGTIRAESRPGHGARFVLELP